MCRLKRLYYFRDNFSCYTFYPVGVAQFNNARVNICVATIFYKKKKKNLAFRESMTTMTHRNLEVAVEI